MNSKYAVKMFFLCSLLFLLVFLFKALTQIKESQMDRNNYNLRVKWMSEEHMKAMNHLSPTNDLEDVKVNKDLSTLTTQKKVTDLKYILLWTSPRNVPFVYLGKGQEGFISRKCPYTNCFVTGDRNYLGDIKKFDVIAFCGPEFIRLRPNSLPQERSPHQKYAFASIESPDYYPICNSVPDNFFNWTWTYKTTSDSRWGYIAIRDANNKVIGPNKDMHWIKLEDMDPVSDDLKAELAKKTKAAAWFVSNCHSKSGREKIAAKLNIELAKYNYSVDIYGTCGNFKCSRDGDEDCDLRIKKDYFFYLSFENSIAEDYVTEKLVRALKNNAIPIVYGGANYSRFLPDGTYLNAKELDVGKLAEKMVDLIRHPDEYAEYFRWQNHYSYFGRHEDLETDDYCHFCTLLNDEELVKQTSVYNIKQWWNNPNRC